MPHAIWTGSIRFGLVTIPVKLLPAVHADEDVHFHFLHAKDGGRLRSVRKCEVCGNEIGWKDTIRGFELEKGKYLPVDDDELKQMRPEATQTVEIQAFVGRDEIDPRLFDTTYYLEPDKRGRRAYALLRDALAKTGRVGIAQVVLRTRAHLAALSANGKALVVELLHYPHEVASAAKLDLPDDKSKAAPGEMKSAEMLIDAMVEKFDPGKYKDDYEDQLKRMLRTRASGQGPKSATRKAPGPSNLVDLAEVLRRSLAQHAKKAPKTKPVALAVGARTPAPHVKRKAHVWRDPVSDDAVIGPRR